MKSIVLIVSIWIPSLLQAQEPGANGNYSRESIENTEIGWMKKLEFKEPVKAFTGNGRTYNVKQMEFTRQIGSWMQQTLTPKGLLGEIITSIYAPPNTVPPTSKSYDFNAAEKNNLTALPNTYGAYAKLYFQLKKTGNKKFWPQSTVSYHWSIQANGVEMISKQQVELSSPDDYYFIMPRYYSGIKGEFDKDYLERDAQYRNFTNSPNLKNIDHFLVPPKVLDYGNQPYYVIIMTKDRQPLPFEQVTVAGLIERLEKHLPVMYTISINNGTKINDLLENAKRGIQYMKERYKKQLNHFVYLSSLATQIDILSLAQIEPGKDVYWLKTQALVEENGRYSANYIPLYRLKKGVKEACATSGPQWIVFRLEKGVEPGNAGEVHLMDNFVSRFNYDYVYDYYFVKNKETTAAYKPVAFTNKDEQVKSTQPASEISRKMASDKSVLFYEDFSTGMIPAGWTTERGSSGDKITVVEVAGTQWLKLKRNASPTKLSLSGDFTISFEVMVQKGDVPWGTPGMQLNLMGAGQHRFGIDVSPGDMNRKDAAGWVMISQFMPAGYQDCKIDSYYSLPDFKGSEQVNRATMTIKRTGTRMVVLSNNQQLFACDKAVPANFSFDKVQFYVNEKNVFHISNIIVRKS